MGETMVKKRAIVYPYHADFGPVVRFSNLLGNYELVSLMAPLGFGLNEKDAAYSYYGEDVGIKVKDSFSDDEFDVLMICEFECSFEKVVFPTIIKAAEMGKDIVLLNRCADHEVEMVKKVCLKNNVELTSFFGIDIDRTKVELVEKILLDINVPIICVASLMEKSNKFDVQLSLRDYFLKEGYKVSQIGTKSYCEIMGFHSFPDFMFNHKEAEIDKIFLFNHFCKYIELNERPDVMIIGIPGGTMVYNNLFTNRFGITAFEAASAIHPDVGIMNLTYDDFNGEFLDKICVSTKHKLGFDIDCFNMSNHKFDTGRSKQDKELKFFTVDSKLVDEKIAQISLESKVPLFNSLNGTDTLKLAECCEALLLQENMQIV
ncbi:TIGR04066 family peptide maturation system protein [Paenibacillus sp. FSL L8-0323]|uniref:TIGR04066 family peptide maturation system protein n=2 Tax=Paenibacillus TaxID=44249 RepID=UPI0009B881A2|nr:TIGR04066 family peptide maturation system protein [Paenibacillus odorifer]OZQ74645.1 hypothetical protein CA596_16585 [Paenibacillus odorifer]